MTYNAIKNQTVEGNAGIFGVEGRFNQVFPDIYTANTSGAASVTTNLHKTTVDPGSTTGDAANIRFGGGDPNVNYNEFEAVKHYILFELTQSNPTNEIEVGTFRAGIGTSSGGGAYMDLTSGEFNMSGTTQSTSVPSSDSGLTLLEITMENAPGGGDRTVFETSGQVNDKVTISGSPFRRRTDAIVNTYSQGSNEGVNIIYHRFEWSRID